MSIAWRNKKTGLWLIQTSFCTHTGEHNKYSETDDLNKASILVVPHYSVRISKMYEPVQVNIVRVVTIKEVI